MLKGIVINNNLEPHKGRQLHNYHKPIEYNYNETTTNKSYDFYKPHGTDWNKILYMGNQLKNPLPASNVYVGAKNIRPIQESKGYTGLEKYSSNTPRDNVLPFVNTFNRKSYYTYV